ncbi:MAG: hypothetical protein IKR39_12055 [Lachnospiraceae bacterium]|nr:hypothetical protein [Lachnospiraceae bacterium]
MMDLEKYTRVINATAEYAEKLKLNANSLEEAKFACEISMGNDDISKKSMAQLAELIKALRENQVKMTGMVEELQEDYLYLKKMTEGL